MSITGLSAAGLSSVIQLTAESGASANTWKALGQSLAKSDLKTAQTLYSSYERMIARSSSLSSGTQFAKELASLGSALTKGDLATAKTAYATVSDELKNNPALTMANTQAATERTIQWLDDLLSLKHSNSILRSDSADPAAYALTAAYGYTPPANSTELMTSLLNTAYGTSTSAAPTGSSATASTGTTTKTGT
jgi:hypothetical protein